jgi:acyl transferase domain-containing protein/acyl carrier protein
VSEPLYEASGGDIAIVGMAGRFPGARNVSEFWRNLTNGVESITQFSRKELLAAGVSAQDVADPRYVSSAPVLDDIELFDAGFFGFAPKDAQVTDPQQRLFLEVAWEAFEDAGYEPGLTSDSIGVFAGCAISTYLLSNLSGNPAVSASASNLQLALGNDKDSLATRVAYALDLRGPSFTVQSYCSTSLVAVSTACTSLLSGECDMALAGGVAISVPHRVGYLYQEGGISSPDGRCRAFDADAMGAPIGNGGAAVVLRRLGDAVAAGDHIYAVIKGWAVNNDGSLKAGFPAPGVRGQARVIADAMANADIEPADVDYVEAHGTGTALGDAAEFAALTKAFAGSPGNCAIGSLKTNVGHLDRAAGVTGLIKTALSLQHRTLVPTLHFTHPNPELDFASSPFHVQVELEAWPDRGRPGVAGVSSFGIGGTNAHVVLAEAPAREPAGPPAGEQVLVMSGRCADSADARITDLADHLTRIGDVDLADVAYTLQAGRRQFACRRAVVAADTADAVSALNGGRVIRQDNVVADRGVEIEFGQRLPVAAVSGLYGEQPLFAAAVDRCCAELTPPAAQLVRLALSAEAHDAPADAPADLVTFVSEYALAELITNYAVRVTKASGTGAGADVARCVLGQLSLADGLRRTTERAWETADAPQSAGPAGDELRLTVGYVDDTEDSPRPGQVRLFAGPGTRRAASAVRVALAELWVAGTSVDWAAEHQSARRRVSLPTYPFQRQRYWIDPVATVARPPQTRTEPDEPASRQPMEKWLYTEVWQAEPVVADAAGPAGPDLVFADSLGIGARLAAGASSAADCVTVLPGDRFSRLGPESFMIRPDHEEDYVELFKQLSVDGILPRTVVHLWSVSAGRADNLSAEAVRAEQITGFFSVLYLVRCLGPASVDGVRLLVATSDAFRVDGSEAPAPGKATLAGLALSVQQEHPGISCRLVDLSAATGAEGCAGQLSGELGWHGSGAGVAFRADQRFTRRFEPARRRPAGPPAVRDGGVYLLTGGLGKIGLLVARYLAEQASCRIVLAGRHGLPPRADWDRLLRQDGQDVTADQIRGVRALEETGAEIVVEAVDVADQQAMHDLVAGINQRFGQLDGVVHSAGRTAADGFTTVEKLSAELVEEHFAPKVYGTLALAAVLAGQQLDFCVLQSSISSVLGGLGFAAYAAANAFLDAYGSTQDGSAGAAWQVIDWDTWEHVAEDLRSADLGTSMSQYSMSSGEGLQMFDLILRGDSERLVVSTGDLERRLEQWAYGADPLHEAAATPRIDHFPRPKLIEVCVPPATRLEQQLVELWQDVLGLDEVGVNDNFFELGGNSLVLLQLVTRMQKALKRPIQAAAMLGAPTVRLLIDQIGLTEDGRSEAAAGTADLEVGRRQSAPGTVRPRTGVGSDVAIIGMAGRFPGASTVDEFWQNLRNGVESITRFTDAELSDSGVPAEQSGQPDYLPLRPVLTGVEDFDAEFFGSTTEQARLVDPQHRVFQECAWEALETAGYVGQSYPGAIGVFGGSNFGTYLHRLIADPVLGPRVDERVVALGNDKDSLTSTISYNLNLRGPSVSVQSFCSTSLVAVHLACRSLRDGECDMALAGGVSIRVPDRVGQFGEHGHDGHVRCFDTGGRGLLKGDGAAIVLLKRLSDAIADGDTVEAVIKGSAVNNDGAMKGGYDAPSVAGQARVVAQALHDAAVPPETISYVEAHGGSTLIGDQIEVAALASAFAGASAASALGTPWCALGSAKANVGHLEHASGVTGLIKTVLSLRERTLPPLLHFRTANPGIDFGASPFYCNTSLAPWEPTGGTVRRAGVTSLGLGGTNAHVIVEEAARGPVGSAGRQHQILPLSARTDAALRMSAARLANYLRGNPGGSLADIAFTLQVGRATFEHRMAVVCESIEEAIRLLDAPFSASAACVPNRPAEFLFDGAVPVVDEPEFTAVVDRCRALLDEPVTTEQATFVGQYALAELLRTWGIRPRLMSGRGVGARVAAFLSGELPLARALLSLDDAVAVPGPQADVEASPGSTGEPALVICGCQVSQPRGDLIVTPVTSTAEVGRSVPTALAELWVSGVSVDWAAYHGREHRRRIPLPTYPFQRQRCWYGHDPRAPKVPNQRRNGT